MAKYIDADKLKAHYAWWGDNSSERTLFDAIIDVQPAADVVEVRRAAWQSWEQDKPPCKWYSCDYCGFHALSRSNHCPNCGADMRQTGDEKEV